MTFPITAQNAVLYDAPLPAQAEVVIIGGGIIGIMSAWFLAEQGVDVVVLEKGRVAGEQSSRNWGWIRQQGRDDAELPIMVEARALWQEIERQLDVDIGLREEGTLYLARSTKSLANYEKWLTHARANGIESRVLTPLEVDAKVGASTGAMGGLYTPSDMKAEPHLAVPAIARAAVRKGVKIIENCAVRAIDLEAGRVAGVVTEKGRIRTSEVVAAGGAWTSLLLRRVGVWMPQLSVRSSVSRTSAFAAPQGQMSNGLFAIRRRIDGGVTLTPSDVHDFYIGPDAFRHFKPYLTQLKRDFSSTKLSFLGPKDYPDSWVTSRKWSADEISPFEKMRVLNPAPNMRYLGTALQRLNEMFPKAGGVKIEQAWAGMIDTMPDVVPVIDRAVNVQGLTIATGMAGHGFGIGPGVGKVVANLVQGKSAGHELLRFRLGRFSDGSPIDLGTAL